MKLSTIDAHHRRSTALFLAALLIVLISLAACAAPLPVADAALSAPAAGAELAAPAADSPAPVADAVAADPATLTLAVDADRVVVDTDWLAERLTDPQVRVIEVSVIPGVYERGHIPGAVNFVWHTDFVDTVRRDIVSRERFEELVRAAGIHDDSTIVLYGDNNNWFAAWGAWVLKLYGAQDVRILDGGRAKWEAEGRELAVIAPTPAVGTFSAAAADPALRAFLPDVLSIVEGDVKKALVDIRSPAEFEGAIFAPEGFQELAVRAGHIPTAVNVPWKSAVNEDGTFKSVEELRALYAAAGIDGSKPVVVYCRIGERASHTWFVLSQILGYDAALYDGSWTEWGNTVGVPIENIAGTVWGAQ
jgi:thiosulfate/3-mercaptopyruvate sulfurtransferase